MSKILFDIRTATEAEEVYTDSGTGADKRITVFQANLEYIPEGYYIIGQVAVREERSKDVPLSSLILVKPLDSNLIRNPVDYDQKWNDKGTGGSMNCAFWRVRAPDGYVALGDVVTNNYLKPPTSFNTKYACIREDLLVPGELNQEDLWNDKGSGSASNGSVWQVDGPGLAGFFKVQNSYYMPEIPVFVVPAKIVQ